MHWRLERAYRWLLTQVKSIRRFVWNLRAARFPRDGQGLFRLHIGCGDVDAPGFVNVDARTKPHVHITSKNLFDLRMIPDGSASLVYMSHVLEHVPYAQINRVLSEMRRVLAPGGKFRVSVPDFDLLVRIYQENNREPQTIIGPLMGGQDYAFNFHYTIFTENSLRSALVSAGFVDVHRWDPKQLKDQSIDDWSGRPINVCGKSYPVSLNIQAITPIAC